MVGPEHMVAGIPMFFPMFHRTYRIQHFQSYKECFSERGTYSTKISVVSLQFQAECK